jgi:hypothetical protein
MQILNVGPLELIFFFLLAFILLGQDGMVGFAKKSAQWIAKIIRSPYWRELVNTSEEVKSIPQKLIQGAKLDQSLSEIKEMSRSPLGTKEDLGKNSLELPESEDNKSGNLKK